MGSFIRTPWRLPQLLRGFLAAVPIWRAPLLIAALLAFGRWSSDVLRSRLYGAMSAVAPRVWRARIRAVSDTDTSERLRSVRAPILYLRGRSDRLIPRSAWLLIRKMSPTARLVEIEGPHFLLQAKPVESAAQVTSFAREIGFAL